MYNLLPARKPTKEEIKKAFRRSEDSTDEIGERALTNAIKVMQVMIDKKLYPTRITTRYYTDEDEGTTITFLISSGKDAFGKEYYKEVADIECYADGEMVYWQPETAHSIDPDKGIPKVVDKIIEWKNNIKREETNGKIKRD